MDFIITYKIIQSAVFSSYLDVVTCLYKHEILTVYIHKTLHVHIFTLTYIFSCTYNYNHYKTEKLFASIHWIISLFLLIQEVCGEKMLSKIHSNMHS